VVAHGVAPHGCEIRDRLKSRFPEAVLPIEIVLRNGRVLRVSDGVAPARAAALADALEGR
jgi:hypothetical protein